MPADASRGSETGWIGCVWARGSDRITMTKSQTSTRARTTMHAPPPPAPARGSDRITMTKSQTWTRARTTVHMTTQTSPPPRLPIIHPPHPHPPMQVQTSAFVFDALLPRTRGHKATMFAPLASVMAMDNDHFSFDHAR